MSWLGGVARTFVRVSSAQQVQLDLKWQRAEGHGMPEDLLATTELLNIVDGASGGVRFMKMGPLVKAKFQSYGRGKPGDYADLLFVCKHSRYGADVEAVAGEVRVEKREMFVLEVGEKNPGDVEVVRRLLGVEEGSPGGESE